MSNDHDGMGQFEHAIQKIAAEIQCLDRDSPDTAFGYLEELTDALHSKLTTIHRHIGAWAQHWIPDALGVTSEFDPRFTDIDVAHLREARRLLGKDIEHLEASLPDLGEFPDSMTLLQIHQDLSQFEKLKQDIDHGVVPALADSSQEAYALAQQLLEQIGTLKGARTAGVMDEHLRDGDTDDLFFILGALGIELTPAIEWRKISLKQRVIKGEGLGLNQQGGAQAGESLTQEQAPFGLSGVSGKIQQLRQLESIRVLGSHPADADTWVAVADELELLKRLSEFAVRWNALARDLQLEGVPGTRPEDGLVAAQSYALSLQNLVCIETEIRTVTAQVFPNWHHGPEVTDDVPRLSELESALRHHRRMHRLAQAWARKEDIQKVLESRTGSVIDDLRQFLREVLGNPEVTDTDMQTRWSEVTAELARIHSLRPHLVVVREVCDKVAASGAPQYAAALKQAIRDPGDELLPDSWRKAWQLRRLTTSLESADMHGHHDRANGVEVLGT